MPQQMPMTEEQQKALQEKLKKMSPEELKEFQKQQCIFCQIIAEKIPSKKVYEDDKSIAILDINPATPGHILLLPKEHYAIMPQITDGELGRLFCTAKTLSQTLLRTLKANGTSLFVANGVAAGQKAQHFMIHIIPRKEGETILTQEEKVIPESKRQPVLVPIENKFNEIMGSKKAVVAFPEQPAEKKALKTKKKRTAQKEEEKEINLDDISTLFK